MEYIYAAMLLHRAGKPITEENLSAVLHAAGVNVDANRVKALVAALSEVDIDEVIKTAAAVPMAAPAAPAPAEAEEKVEEEKKEKEEEKKEEEKEEEVLEGLSALFG